MKKVNNLMMCLFNIIVPTLAILNNKFSFLGIMTLYYLIMITTLIAAFKHVTITNSIFRILFLINWGIHHSSFLAMAIISSFDDDEIINIYYICKICGIIVILTVICGGVI